MKIKVRKMSIADIPQLVDKMNNFYNILIEKGAKDISHDQNILRGGIVIEIGGMFNNPELACCIVALEETGKLVGFIIGLQEFCSPVENCWKRVRVHGIYIENDSLAAPRIIEAMWKELECWGQQIGAGYFYANIHPGNQPSVRAAKSAGFKHHYTQFYRPIKLDQINEQKEEI